MHDTTPGGPHAPHAVVVGAGPVGLWTAGELALAGVRTTLLEQTGRRSENSKALGLLPRTLEVLALRGALGPVLTAGRPLPRWHFGMLETLLDFQQLDTPYPFMLSVPQTVTESVLEQRALDLGVEIQRDTAFRDLQQTADEVLVTTERDGRTTQLRADLLVGADGARSGVRAAAGIAFPGEPSSNWGFLGDVHLTEPPPPGFRRRSPEGALIVAPLPDGTFRVTGWDPEHQDRDEELDLETLRATTVRIAGADFGMHDPRWLSRFGDANRLAATYRAGRVLLAGDAAHVHWPTGGLGLNAGLQDAMDLGWRAAAFLHGTAPASTLDRYGDERHDYGQELRRSTLAQGALIRARTPAEVATREVVDGFLRSPEGNAHTAGSVSCIDLAYARGDGDDPLVGRRCPLPVGDPAALAEFLDLFMPGELVLLSTTPEQIAAVGVPSTTGRLPADVAARLGATAVVVRPDGHIAWASRGTGAITDADVRAALVASGALLPR
ncbi:FAD-dependent monooxygenase [Modestobacter sp. L9-4]|uniref:FAD-dependent monooxygenase n=1 Tax=Modestobacter sp. L9-4 TaxID=2851567 RepID=UPI001C7678E7|nr:FAD-dependent monooxygenase [Modestobacter sp. L9-4]QXG74877.1 FAD-dependent monooxygenase [Modestobacter sp. L9-4]